MSLVSWSTAAPNSIARLGFALAHSLDNKAPAVSDLTDDEQSQVERIAEVLKKAKQPLVICGTGSQSMPKC